MDTFRTGIITAVDKLENDMVTFIQRLVRKPSMPGEEGRVQPMIAQKLESLGMAVTSMPVDPELLKAHPAFCDDGYPYENRMNVIGLLKGVGGNSVRSLIVNGHTDVVSPGDEEQWPDSPWSGAIRNRRIHGRGSADMKSGLAAGIFALEAIRRSGTLLEGDLTIQCVAGEETGGCGTLAAIMNGFRADAAIITEPTSLKICPVQSGALSFRLTIKGRSVHACLKNKGVSAIEKFIPVFQAMEVFNAERHRQYQNDLYPTPENIAPTSIGTLNSGDWPSTVPDKLVAKGRFGIFPDESVENARDAFETMIGCAAEKDDWLKQHPPVVEWCEGQFEAGATDLDAPIIQTLDTCHQAITGKRAALEGVTYGSDLRLFTNHAGIPAVLYGPGDVLDAHTVDESIAISEILTATKILALTILAWCGVSENRMSEARS